MNAKHRNFLVGAAMVAVTVPAMGFAARDAFVGNPAFGKFFGDRSGTGSENRMDRRAGFGPESGRPGERGVENLLTNDEVRKTLAASGVVLPSEDEMKAYAEGMKAARDAESKLPDADKAELKKLRDATMEKVRAAHEEGAKAERDYLRSKGVALPNEETIAKMRTTMEKAGEVLRSKMPQGGFGPRGKEGGRREGREEGRGTRGKAWHAEKRQETGTAGEYRNGSGPQGNAGYRSAPSADTTTGASN